MKLIHYSKEKIDLLENRKYPESENRWQAKPNGLWVSVENPERLPNNYNWKEWCEAEDFMLENLTHAHEIVLHENSNILHLKTANEIFEFTKKYPFKTRNWDPENDTYQLSWDQVKKTYQGIIIAPYQFDCRITLESSWYYGWDCASGCIWDLSCIEKFQSVS